MQSFERTDPCVYGFDAAVEFPPNNVAPPKLNSDLIPLREDFAATVYDWRAYPQLSENYSTREYKLFRSVCPGWDNTARRKSQSTIFINNTPQLYRSWLENAIKDTVEHVGDPDERLVFVNAWNEWAEGAHLEPDRQTGYAYLQATRDALISSRPSAEKSRIVIVAHDAYAHGAQFLSLNLSRAFRDEFNFEVDLISLGDGPLLERYADVATLHRLDIKQVSSETVLTIANGLRAKGADIALVNTTVSGSIVPALKRAGFTVVSLVHELSSILSGYALEQPARAIADQADTVVFASERVRDSFESFVGRKLGTARICHRDFIFATRSAPPARAALCEQKFATNWGCQPMLASYLQWAMLIFEGCGPLRRGNDVPHDARPVHLWALGRAS